MNILYIVMDKSYGSKKLGEHLSNNLNNFTMDLISIFLLAIALSMAAFRVSITRGLV